MTSDMCSLRNRTASLLKASPKGEGFHPPREWKVMAEIAVVSGSPSLSITSRSITTDVSSRPHDSEGVTARVGRSDIDVLVDERIDIGAEPRGIDPRRYACRRRNGGAGNEPMGRHRFQFSYRSAVTGHDHMLARLNIAQNGRGLVAELPLVDRTHPEMVADIAFCSKCFAALVAP